jgi:hypothetical protein
MKYTTKKPLHTANFFSTNTHIVELKTFELFETFWSYMGNLFCLSVPHYIDGC